MDTADRFLKPEAGFDVFSMIFERANAELMSPQPAHVLRLLGECYRKAEKDTDARIPSYLQAAIENAMRLVVEPASPYAERRAVPRYQEQRSGGTDIGPSGLQLKPGS